MKWIKDNWLIVIILIGAFILFLNRNPFGGPDSNNKADTSVKSNTVYVPQAPIQIPVYIPIRERVQAPTNIPPDYNASADYKELLKQYQDIVNRYLSTTTYKDSVILKDSAGKQVGVVNLEDKISKNEIISRKPDYQLTFPVTTNTITITQPYKPRNQIYLGGGLTGTQLSPVDGAYLGFLWKNKRDQIYGLNAGIINVNGTIQPQFGINMYYKIKLKK
jgi:hypothetical protein